MKFIQQIAQWSERHSGNIVKVGSSNLSLLTNQWLAQRKSDEFLTRPMNFGVQHMHEAGSSTLSPLTNFGSVA